MAKYSAFQAPIFALFDPGLYDEVRYEWKGTNLLYLLGLIFFITVAIALSWFFQLTNASNTEMQKVIGQLPVMTFKGGELSIDKASPYRVSNPWPTAADEGEALMVFDTSGGLTTPEEAKAAVLFTKTAMVSTSGKETPYALFGSDGRLDQPTINSLLRMAIFWIPILFVLIGLPLLWSMHALQALLYAGVVALIGQMTGSSLAFDAALRIAIMCMTPVMLLSTAMTIGNVQVPFWPFLTIPIVIGYTVFAVRTTARN